MSNVECLWMSKTEPDPNASAIAEKLSVHGYAIALNRMEEGKLQTAELCIHDVLVQNESPNIVIVCPESRVNNWYCSLLWDMGVEFKYIGVFERSLDIFSPSISNCCIASAESLLCGGSVLCEAGNAGFIWDLMIIDLPHLNDAAIGDYAKSVKTKTKKLLVNLPASDTLGANYEKLSAFVKALLHRNKKEEKGAEYPIDLSGANGQVVAGRSVNSDYNIKTINYKINTALVAKTERIDDRRSGIPLYSYGGNLFEEYNLPEREIYLNKEYDKKELKDLLSADAKLEAFLKEIVTLLSDADNRIVVYCTSQNTAAYVSKALWACNGGKKGICVYDRNSVDIEYINSEFGAEKGEEPQIIVADDAVGARFLNIGKITHIINYEYPENPAVLEQRLTRTGRKPNNPAFYIFCDEDYRFDGRMLRKTVLSNFGSAFCAISDKSLLFNIENIEEHLIVLVLDLKFICDNASEDIVESFRVEYNAPGVKTAADAAATAKKRLKKLVDMFGLQGVMEQKELDGERLFMQFTEKIEEFKGKRVRLDEKGVLSLTADKSPSDAKGNKSNKNESAPSKRVAEIKNAENFVKKLTGKKEDFTLIKSETQKLPYYLKLSALVNVWKHYRFTMNISKPYKDFIKLYNLHDKGVI
ncbi:MAG: hypothetical protein FWG70_04610 [Oscillospiraceae bacterium]|nr:hypothetical protein [Oscillospiraceae bacterium]